MSSRPQTVQGRIESGLRQAAFNRSQGSLIIQQCKVKPGSAGVIKLSASQDPAEKAAIVPLSARYARPRTCSGSLNGSRTYGLAHRRALGLAADTPLPTMPTCLNPNKNSGMDSLPTSQDNKDGTSPRSQTLVQSQVLQRYDDELLRTIFGLREHRDELDHQIAQEEADKAEIERHIKDLAEQLERVNSVLSTKTDVWKDHDRTLKAMEGAHKNITDSSSTLLHVIRREHVNLAKKHFGEDLSASYEKKSKHDQHSRKAKEEARKSQAAEER